jgi:hypothetical protein
MMPVKAAASSQSWCPVSAQVQLLHAAFSPLLQLITDAEGRPVELGEGAHAVVYLGRLQGEEVAVKVGGARHLAATSGVRGHLSDGRAARCVDEGSVDGRTAPSTFSPTHTATLAALYVCNLPGL